MYQMIMNYICEFFTRDTLFNQTQYNELGKGSFIIHFFKPLLTHIFQFDKILWFCQCFCGGHRDPDPFKGGFVAQPWAMWWAHLLQGVS